MASLLGLRQRSHGLAQRVLALRSVTLDLGQFDEDGGILKRAVEFPERFQYRAVLVGFVYGRLGLVLVVPEAGRGTGNLECGQFLLAAFDVKDTPASRYAWPAGPPTSP
jgi:hypothetical protein